MLKRKQQSRETFALFLAIDSELMTLKEKVAPRKQQQKT
jgi:hypothetical protein